jgi:hypothetical protein
MRLKVMASLLLTVALLVACGGGKPASNPPPAKESTKAAPVVQPTSKPAVEATQLSEEYGFDQSSNLARLSSYRVRYVWQWQDTKDGKTETGSWDLTEEFTQEGPARRTVWSGTNAAGEAGQGAVEIIQIGNESYMKTGNEWIAMTSNENVFQGNAFLSDPLGLVSSTRGKLVKRGESVNGVSADHYTFDESTIAGLTTLGSVAKAKGDVWISPELNVVVKYVVHYEGQQLKVGGGDNGILDVALDLTDVNKPISIKAPEGVKPAMPEDIPLMEGATDVTAVSGIVSFKTDKSVADVAAYYEQAMPGQGWTKEEGGIAGMLSFAKGERKATVVIQGEVSGKTSVTIMAQ